MTPEQLKKLAEFAAEYLGFFFDEEIERWIPPREIKEWSPWCKAVVPSSLKQMVFNMTQASPILMHLAQEKLEKEGFDCEYNQQVGIHLWEFNMSLDYDRPVARAENKNKFIAFWEATRQAKV